MREVLHCIPTLQMSKPRPELARDDKAGKRSSSVDCKAQGLTCCCILPFRALHLPENMRAIEGPGEDAGWTHVGSLLHLEEYPSTLLMASSCQ